MKKAYVRVAATANPASREHKLHKVRRATRAARPSRAENATRDMAEYERVRAAGYDDNGAVIAVTDALPFNEAALQEWISGRANAGRLLFDIEPGRRFVVMSMPAAYKLAASRVKNVPRAQLLPAAQRLVEYLTDLNGGRATYAQRHPDAPSAMQVMMRGHYAGPREVEVILDGYPFVMTMTTSGWFHFTGEVVVPALIARKGRLLEAQQILDGIAEAASTGQPFDLDAYALAHVQRITE